MCRLDTKFNGVVIKEVEGDDVSSPHCMRSFYTQMLIQAVNDNGLHLDTNNDELECVYCLAARLGCVKKNFVKYLFSQWW